MLKQFLFLFVTVFTINAASAQVPEFDQLEMFYAQGLYKKVYKKSNQYLNKPEYDYSLLPSFYRSLSMFQLSTNERWRKQHPNAVQDARNMMMELRSTQDGIKVLEMHVNEISSLKSDLMAQMGEYKRMELNAEFNELQLVMTDLFSNIPTVETQGQQKTVKPSKEIVKEFEFKAEDRNEMIQFAQNQIGVPYVWAGNTPSGFDCSGFTGYVMSAYHKSVPRRAADQYAQSTKIKEKQAQKGDLVFFDNGSGISHVGMVISEQGEPIVMIHASTSKGVIVTAIDESEYWKKRLAGFGTYLK